MYNHEKQELTLTDGEVLDLLAKVVAEKPNHVYMPPVMDADADPDGTCMYFEPSEGWIWVDDQEDPFQPQGEFVPSCLIGHVLAAAGVPYFDLMTDNDDTVTQITAIDLQISERALQALALAQKAQDGNLDAEIKRMQLSRSDHDHLMAKRLSRVIYDSDLKDLDTRRSTPTHRFPWRVAGEVAKVAMETLQ